jgi:hypothetical protein
MLPLVHRIAAEASSKGHFAFSGATVNARIPVPMPCQPAFFFSLIEPFEGCQSAELCEAILSEREENSKILEEIRRKAVPTSHNPELHITLFMLSST